MYSNITFTSLRYLATLITAVTSGDLKGKYESGYNRSNP